MAKKEQRELKLTRKQVEEAWRATHNFLAGIEGLIALRDVLTIGKDAYDDYEKVEASIVEATKELEAVNGNLTKAKADLKKAGEKVEAEMASERQRVQEALEREKLGAATSISRERESWVGELGVMEIRRTELKNDIAALNQDRDRLVRETDQKRQELQRVTGQLDAIRANLPQVEVR